MKVSTLFSQVLVWPRWETRARRKPTRPRKLVGRARQARNSLAYAPVVFVFLLTVGWGAAEAYAPKITDTEYHYKLETLQTAIAAHPDNPLGLVIGSSRLVWGFRPETLPEPQPGNVYWLNGAHVGYGPVLNRLMLHRLLRDGVKPKYLVLEVMPVFFVRENARFIVGQLAPSEMKIVRPYQKSLLHYDSYFVRHRIWRIGDLGRVFDPFFGVVEPLPRGGHPKCQEEVTEEERERRMNTVRIMYRNDLATMTVSPSADRAFRDTLRVAAANDIRVVVLRTPEGPKYQSLYRPEGTARFDAYLAGISKEFQVPILDAQNWLDEEDFYDSHHTLRPGGDKFTNRFIREIAPLTAP